MTVGGLDWLTATGFVRIRADHGIRLRPDSNTKDPMSILNQDSQIFSVGSFGKPIESCRNSCRVWDCSTWEYTSSIVVAYLTPIITHPHDQTICRGPA